MTTITNRHGKVFGEEPRNIPISPELKRQAAEVYKEIEGFFKLNSKPMPSDWDKVHDYLMEKSKSEASERVLKDIREIQEKIKKETGVNVGNDVIFSLGKRGGKRTRKQSKKSRKTRKQLKK